MTSQHNQYEAGYNKGVEEIFFNICRKRWEVEYRFLGVEFKKLMATWTAREHRGTRNTRSPSSPQYSDADEDDEVVRVEPPNKAPDQAPPANVGEEEPTTNTPDKAPLA